MNQLFQGDNLEILHNMPGGSVDLICTDPPFNTGKDWGAFDDRWEGGLDEYLKFMEARVVEMRRVLKDTGSLYLHCDPTASHYLKVMLDSVFGIKQFRNEIVWHYLRTRPKNNEFSLSHNIIFRYSKADIVVWNQLYEPLSDTTIKRCGHKKQLFKKTEKGTKVHALTNELSKGSNMRDVWKDIEGMQWCAKQKTGYPTQKPVALYERMIKASSNQGDIVLDPFAGSGTTLDAAHTLGRHWIGVDVGDAAIETIQERMRNRHGLEYDRDYEIIRGT